MRHEQRFVWLDLVRGICALLVCASHLRVVVLVDHAAIEQPGWADHLLYLATGLGHPSVMVFFVLSGFFVGGSLLRGTQGFDPGRYALARLTRLWVVLLPALVVTALVDALFAARAPEVLAGAYRDAWHSGPFVDADYSGAAATFVANLLFLQTIAAPVFGSNGPLWSLANEFWYYVLFPLCLLAAGGRLASGPLGAGGRLAAAAAAAAVFAWLPADIRLGYAVWLLGVAVAWSAGRLGPRAARAAVGAGALALAAALAIGKSAALRSLVPVPGDLLVGASFGLLAAGLVNGVGTAWVGHGFARFAKWLSDISYSLYLVHFPLVLAIGTFTIGPARLQPEAPGLLLLAAWLLVLVACGHGFWWLAERHTDAVRARVSALLRAGRSLRR